MKTMRLLLPALLISAIYHAQTLPAAKNETEEDEDIEYELRHKSQPWFSEMKDNADYFKVKANFDKYFGNHRWEKASREALAKTG